jgi:hypothetical protein
MAGVIAVQVSTLYAGKAYGLIQFCHEEASNRQVGLSVPENPKTAKGLSGKLPVVATSRDGLLS